MWVSWADGSATRSDFVMGRPDGLRLAGDEVIVALVRHTTG